MVENAVLPPKIGPEGRGNPSQLHECDAIKLKEFVKVPIYSGTKYPVTNIQAKRIRESFSRTPIILP